MSEIMLLGCAMKRKLLQVFGPDIVKPWSSMVEKVYHKQ